MVRGSSAKRKRPLVVTAESDFLASPKHASNRIGLEESPTDDRNTSKVCSIADSIAPSKRQSSLLSFFQKNVKPKPKPTSDPSGGAAIDTSHRNRPPVRSFIPPEPKRKKSLTQFHLDCGQSKFGQTLCNKCGMLYVPGVAEDETEHKKMCEAYALGIPCHRGNVKGGKKINSSNRKNETIVSWRPCVKKSKSVAFDDSKEDPDRPSQWPLLAKMISKDLGTHEETTLDHLSREIVFLYVACDKKKHRILGVATCQLLGKVPAYRMLGPSERSLDPVIAKLGIGLLWTHPSKRNQGIATRLVNIAREHSCFGMRIFKHHLAFSNPTTAGYNFAIAYGKEANDENPTDAPLVYEMGL